MFFYARADTHFLLYIYDNIRNELIDSTIAEVPEENRIELVLQKSKETSLLHYERIVYNSQSGRGPGGWYSLLIKAPALLNNEQFSVFRAVHEWRDTLARIDDDSTSFVMPQQVLFSIAKLMPMDMVALLGIAHPVSHGVKSRAGELLALIKTAKARGKTGPGMIDVLRPDSLGAAAKENLPAVAAKTAAKTLVAVVDQSDLRSDNSTFWGGAFGSSIWDAPDLTKNDSLRLAVPLPALSSEIFASSNSLADRSRVIENFPSAVVKTPEQTKNEDAAFIIKRGVKRKSGAISDAEDLEEEQTSGVYDIPPEEARVACEKRTSKMQRRAEKEAKKAAEIESEAEKVDKDSDEPFDYGKADSVLHGKRKEGHKGGDKKKPFDPYMKSADAPKGMRRLQTEREGKSHTFKS